MELKRYKLGEIGEIRMCKRILKEETNSVGGVPFFKIGTFGGQADVFITKEKFDEYKNAYSYPKKGDVLISAAGTIGRTVVFDGKDAYFQDSNIVWIENDESKVLNEYLFYCYKNIHWTTSVGSTILRLYNDDIRNTDIIVPPLSEQKKIAAVLSALDDKIALNKKMNQKLERMAKRLYDYWFVQYDFPDKNGHPYKTTGGPMTYSPTLKREIPMGWEVKNVNDVTTSVRGVSYSSDDEKSKTDSNVVQILRGNNISGSRFVFDSNDVFVSSDLVAEEQKISKFDIVMTMSSGSKEHVGKSALALYDMPHSFGAFCSKFTPNAEAKYFIDCYLHSEMFIKYIRQTCSGTGINNLTNGHFDKAFFAWPTNDVLKSFNEKVSAIYEQRGVIEREISRLTALRDKLLPLLMNGQVVVGKIIK